MTQIADTQPFTERPSDDYLRRWREHIEATGEPETFEGVSLGRAPRNVPVRLLSEVMAVPIGKRPNADRVPCPQCSPEKPKFVNGRMAYFPGEQAVWFIGQVCARKHLGEHFEDADRLFRLERTCEAYQALWPKLQEKRPAITAIVGRIYASARRVQSIRKSLDSRAPGFAQFLHSDLVDKRGLISLSASRKAKTYQVEGMRLLSPGFNPRRLAEKAIDVCDDLRTELPYWRKADGDTPEARDINSRGRAATLCLKEMLELRDDIADAARFVEPANLNLLRQWQASGQTRFDTFVIGARDNQFTLLASAYSGRYEARFGLHPDTVADLPTRDEILELKLSETLD